MGPCSAAGPFYVRVHRALKLSPIYPTVHLLHMAQTFRVHLIVLALMPLLSSFLTSELRSDQHSSVCLYASRRVYSSQHGSKSHYERTHGDIILTFIHPPYIIECRYVNKSLIYSVFIHISMQHDTSIMLKIYNNIIYIIGNTLTMAVLTLYFL